MNDIATLLEEEIKKTLNDLSVAKTGSDEAKAALIKLDKLHGQRIKEMEADLKNKQLIDASLAKIDENRLRSSELDLKVKQATEELELKRAELTQKEAELQEAKRGRRWRTVLDILGITVPTAATACWLYKGMKFEEEGKIYSSRTSQWVSNFTRLFKKG